MREQAREDAIAQVSGRIEGAVQAVGEILAVDEQLDARHSGEALRVAYPPRVERPRPGRARAHDRCARMRPAASTEHRVRLAVGASCCA